MTSVSPPQAVACHDGTLWSYQLVFSTVHGLYRDRYAYRENMTDVIIQHLTTGTKLRIKCHDKAHKIAVYKRRLAVSLDRLMSKCFFYQIHSVNERIIGPKNEKAYLKGLIPGRIYSRP